MTNVRMIDNLLSRYFVGEFGVNWCIYNTSLDDDHNYQFTH